MSEQRENVKCVVRVRPTGTNDLEKKMNETCVSTIDTLIKIEVQKSEPKQYSFDYVADEQTSQVEFFSKIGEPILNSFFEGYNCTVFAYGQTGSGKTHTMMGPSSSLFNNQEHEKAGLIPRLLKGIFDKISTLKEVNQNTVASVKCSCAEIYQEQIIDLIRGSSVQNDESKKDMEGLIEQEVGNAKIALELVLLGLKNRHVAETRMNSESSRSHLIFTINLTLAFVNEGLTSQRNCRLNLIDLAGSERQKMTGTKGDRIKEAGMINKSLSTLGNVINALVDEKSKFVPFRDSKLTYFLKDSLGGNSKTTIIANISPCVINVQETISTLKFVQRAKLIKNKATINENVSGTLLSLQDEIKRLKEEVKEKNKYCVNCKKRVSNSSISQFENLRSSIERGSLLNNQELVKIQQQNNLYKNNTINEIINEENETYTKEEIKEFTEKINEFLSLETFIKSKLKNVEQMSFAIESIDSFNTAISAENKKLSEDFEKRVIQIELFFKMKKHQLEEILNNSNSSDQSTLIENFNKIENIFKDEMTKTQEILKYSEEIRLLKSELTKYKNEIIKKDDFDLILTTLEEFNITNNNLFAFLSEKISVMLKDKDVENLNFEIQELKHQLKDFERRNQELKSENYELNQMINSKEFSNNENKDLALSFKELQENYANLQQELSDKKTELEGKYDEINELEKKIHSYEEKQAADEMTILRYYDDIVILIEGNNFIEKEMMSKSDEVEILKNYIKYIVSYFKILQEKGPKNKTKSEKLNKINDALTEELSKNKKNKSIYDFLSIFKDDVLEKLQDNIQSSPVKTPKRQTKPSDENKKLNSSILNSSIVLKGNPFQTTSFSLNFEKIVIFDYRNEIKNLQKIVSDKNNDLILIRLQMKELSSHWNEKEKIKIEMNYLQSSLKLVQEEKNRIEKETQILTSNLLKKMDDNVINQKLGILIKVKEENFKLRQEINDLMKKNEKLQLDLGELKKFHDIDKNPVNIEDSNISKAFEEMILIKNNYNMLIERIFSIDCVGLIEKNEKLNKFQNAICIIEMLEEIASLNQKVDTTGKKESSVKNNHKKSVSHVEKTLGEKVERKKTNPYQFINEKKKGLDKLELIRKFEKDLARGTNKEIRERSLSFSGNKKK